MPENKDFDKHLASLQADIEKLVRKANLPGTVISGFIFSNKPKSLIRFGNTGNKGSNLIKLHLALASFATEIEETNPYPEVGYADIGQGKDAACGESVEDIAYRLAKAVLVSGLEPEYAQEALSLAEAYVASRKNSA